MRDRLLTISGHQLTALDPDSGARTLLFDSAVGPGGATGGFAGIWVAADSTHALAVDRQLGHFYRIDLRTGEKTRQTYSWMDRNGTANTDSSSADFLAAQDFHVDKAKFSANGEVAAIQYRSRDLDSQENYLDLLEINDGSSKRITTDAEVVDFRHYYVREIVMFGLAGGKAS